MANRSAPDAPSSTTRRAVLCSLFSLAGCTALGPDEEATVTPAPVPTPTEQESEFEVQGMTASLVVRNETAYRRTVVASVLDQATLLSEQQATILGGRGVTFERVLPKTYGVIGDDPTTVRLETTDRRSIAERDVVVTRAVQKVVATLGAETVEWAVVES